MHPFFDGFLPVYVAAGRRFLAACPVYWLKSGGKGGKIEKIFRKYVMTLVPLEIHIGSVSDSFAHDCLRRACTGIPGTAC